MPPLRVGLIGLGAIGRGVAEMARAGKAGSTCVDAVLLRGEGKRAAADHYGIRAYTEAGAFLASGIDVVVEAAGAAAVAQHGQAVLDAGIDLIVASVGALSDPVLLERLGAAARQRGRRLLIPSGAIAALDAISAAALEDIDEVVHTTRKPPAAFSAEQLGPEPLDGPRLLYDGPARDGVRRFPENVNVAAAVSLAGIGLDRTLLRIFADPSVTRNTHCVEVRGYFGRLELRIENLPTANPKTGRLVALSIAKALRNLSASVIVGV
jgi:aspartate dehydrogenase